MKSASEALYLDTSALVKLVREETESEALRRYLVGADWQASSALARVELLRAARRAPSRPVAQAERLLSGIDLIPIAGAILHVAAHMDPAGLRTLDAIHLAAALSLDGDLRRLVTYDLRMASAARELGIIVDMPGRPQG